MKRPVYLACLMAALSSVGCLAPRPNTVVVREPVPVPCPPPTVPARPALPTAQLAAEPSLRDLLRSLLADREALAAWALDLETRLKAYLPPPEPTKESTR